MRETGKYKLPASRRRGSAGPIYGILATLLLASVAWVFWHSRTTEEIRKPVKPSAVPATAVKTQPAPEPARPVLAPPTIAPKAVPNPATNAVAKPAIELPRAGVSNSVAVTATNVARKPTPPLPPPGVFPRPVQNVLEAQIVLIGEGISAGSLDGVSGPQTGAALAAYQRKKNLPPSGQLDAATKAMLQLSAGPMTHYEVTSNDLARLQPIADTWMGKSQQTALDYETLLELVAEKYFSHPNLVRRLNPEVVWTNVVPGTVVQVPNVAFPVTRGRAAVIEIHLAEKVLEAFDAQSNLLAHFPCSIARKVEKRPVGELHVATVAPHPNYTFDPEVFPESPEAREIGHKLILPPGPNNPVGVAWIGLDRPGYGIHGTPKPEDVGRTESHGCFRLANWNAEYLLRLVEVGTVVRVME